MSVKKSDISQQINNKLQNVSQLVNNMQILEQELKQLFEELNDEHIQEVNTLKLEISNLQSQKSLKAKPILEQSQSFSPPTSNTRQPSKSRSNGYHKGPPPSYEIPPPPSPNSKQGLSFNGYAQVSSSNQNTNNITVNNNHYNSQSLNLSTNNNNNSNNIDNNKHGNSNSMYVANGNSNHNNNNNSNGNNNMGFKAQATGMNNKKTIGKMKFLPKSPKNDENKNDSVKKARNIDDLPEGITERDFYKKYWIEAGKIGEGAFARVRRITRKSDKMVFALKMIKKKGKSDSDIRALQREITVLQQCDHPNIVQMADWCDTKKRIYMVVEFCDGGDVFERIVQFKKFSEKDAVHVIKQVSSGLGHIHKLKFVHRDLKPDNLMYVTRDANSVIKIIDFGLAGDCNDGPCKTPCGTAHYAAPEVLGNMPYDTTADLWSLGVIVYTLLCGFPPFFDASNNMKNLYHLIKKGIFDFPSPFWDGVSDDAKDLIKKLLRKDPTKRLTTEQILQHQWITGKVSEKDLGNGFVKQMTHWQSTRQATEIKLGTDESQQKQLPNGQKFQLFAK